MRKHRLYGVAFAVLLGMGLVTQRPGTPHHAAGVDLGRTGIRLASAALPVDARPSITPTLDARSGLILLRPGGSRLVAAVWSWRRYIDTPPTPPAPPAPPVPPAPTVPVTAARAVTTPAPPPRAVVIMTPAVVSTPSAAPATNGNVWAVLRQCESGGDYSENTGNGYFGAYQFSLATWRGLGLGGLPSQAPAAVQDQAARRLQARSGWGQWPSCARRLRLA